MILDKLENSILYEVLGENLKKGFDFLKNTDFKELKVGNYEIDGKNVFAMVSEYTTKNHPDCIPEAHQIYTDIQYLVSGREAIGIAILENQSLVSAYNPEKDIAFFSGETSPIILETGMFTVFFPHDLHRPCMQIEGPEKVKKVVVKVKTNSRRR